MIANGVGLMPGDNVVGDDLPGQTSDPAIGGWRMRGNGIARLWGR